MKVAAIQMRSGTDMARNIADMSALVREAGALGATYVQTPEMTGLVQKGRKDLMAAIRRDTDDPVFAAASVLARDHRIWLHIGSTPVLRNGDMVANRAALFSPNGDRVAVYDKIHMFDVDLDSGESWRESAIYQAGTTLPVVEFDDVKLGLAICYDLRFPHLFRSQAMAGANLLTAPAAFTRQTGQAHWHVLLRARAIENGAFVMAAAQGGMHEDGRETYGHSLIIGPWGDVIAEKRDDEPGVITADIAIGDSAAARAKIPNLTHGRDYEMRAVEVMLPERTGSAA